MDQAVEWERLHSEVAWGTVPSTELLSFMAANYWGKNGLEFLDLGCGASTLWLANKGFKVKAVDVSKSACDKLWNNLPDSDKPLVEVINKSVNDIDFEPKSFDCILLLSILECLGVEKSCLLMKNSMKWLKLGGTIFATIIGTHIPMEVNHEGIDLKVYTPDEFELIFNGINRTAIPFTTYVTSECLPVTRWAISVMASNEPST